MTSDYGHGIGPHKRMIDGMGYVEIDAGDELIALLQQGNRSRRMIQDRIRQRGDFDDTNTPYKTLVTQIMDANPSFIDVVHETVPRVVEESDVQIPWSTNFNDRETRNLITAGAVVAYRILQRALENAEAAHPITGSLSIEGRLAHAHGIYEALRRDLVDKGIGSDRLDEAGNAFLTGIGEYMLGAAHEAAESSRLHERAVLDHIDLLEELATERNRRLTAELQNTNAARYEQTEETLMAALDRIEQLNNELLAVRTAYELRIKELEDRQATPAQPEEEQPDTKLLVARARRDARRKWSSPRTADLHHNPGYSFPETPFPTLAEAEAARKRLEHSTYLLDDTTDPDTPASENCVELIITESPFDDEPPLEDINSVTFYEPTASAI